MSSKISIIVQSFWYIKVYLWSSFYIYTISLLLLFNDNLKNFNLIFIKNKIVKYK